MLLTLFLEDLLKKTFTKLRENISDNINRIATHTYFLHEARYGVQMQSLSLKAFNLAPMKAFEKIEN